MNSNLSYSPETVKLGCDLCDFDLWPWPFAWTLLWSMVITPENFMMIRDENIVKKVWQTDRRTDGRTDRRKIPFVELLGLSYKSLIRNVIPKFKVNLIIDLQGWGQVLSEVLEWSTYFSVLQVQVQVLKILGKHQVHQVLFSIKYKYFGNSTVSPIKLIHNCYPGTHTFIQGKHSFQT